MVMNTRLEPAVVANALRKLRSAGTKVFGADSHQFLLNDPLAESVVLTFERKHRIQLPGDYRSFLTTIGNGGAGPYYGVFPLGYMDGVGSAIQPWSEQDGFIGVLSEPYPLLAEWNDLAGMPPVALLDGDPVAYDRLYDQFERRYWNSSIVNGAIPICHQGCALRIWLVITGEKAGQLWHDQRSDYKGVAPLHLQDGSVATFSSWYRDWLEDALQHLHSC